MPPQAWWQVAQFAHVAASVGEDLPKTYKAAMESGNASKWSEACKAEIKSLLENKTWDVVELPEGRKAIGCKWVFKIKERADGSIDKFKARLVAKGYSQEYGIDYEETFAPVAKFTSIRVLLSTTAKYNLDLQQMDVNTAFLNSDLVEDIYMQVPDGLDVKATQGQTSKLVLKLKKSLYGLKQAPRLWNETIDGFMVSIGFTKSNADHCIYVMRTGSRVILVSLYVDDLILASNCNKMMQSTKEALSKRFKMTDLGALSYCLGIEVMRSPSGPVFIHQSKFLKSVLAKFNMQECKPVKTPQVSGQRLSKLMCPTTDDEKTEMSRIPYRSAVGCLMYLMVATRPDIAVAVGVASQFLENPGQQHWSAVKRIFRYLKGTEDFGIEYSGSQDVCGYTDADWAGDTGTRHSTSGYCFMLNNGLVSWKSRKQRTVALSSTEAEYMGLSEASQEAVWMKRLLLDLGEVDIRTPIVVWEDNQGSIALAKNPQHHNPTKHIDIRYHFAREKVQDQDIALKYCPTQNMIADIFTKALPASNFRGCEQRWACQASTP
ncbi:hypothetical protein AeMF1_013507 [Aphanomyces euteiches]|nr:hypothetical protein AeMF1_013507 [Aphanomyces euteiches]